MNKAMNNNWIGSKQAKSNWPPKLAESELTQMHLTRYELIQSLTYWIQSSRSTPTKADKLARCEPTLQNRLDMN